MEFKGSILRNHPTKSTVKTDFFCQIMGNKEVKILSTRICPSKVSMTTVITDIM